MTYRNRSDLRARIRSALDGLALWSSARVQVTAEESRRYTAKSAGALPAAEPGSWVREARSPKAFGPRPAQHCAHAEAARLGIEVRVELLPAEGGPGRVMRVTRVA